MVHIEKI